MSPCPSSAHHVPSLADDLSGGAQGRTQVQTITIHRTPEGTIYIDDKGSVLTNFDPQNGVIEVNNVLGFKIMWKRAGESPVTDQP